MWNWQVILTYTYNSLTNFDYEAQGPEPEIIWICWNLNRKLREITSSEVDIRLILAHWNYCVTVKAVQCSYKAEEHFLLSHDIGSLPIVHKFQLGIFPLPKLLCCIN